MQKAIKDASEAAWPWANAFLRQLYELQAEPFKGSHLLFGSDYSGNHRKSEFQVYGFIIADADASYDWPEKCRSVRDKFLTGSRRMSFKNLNDVYRQRALIPFLEAAESIEGRVVTIAVNKNLTQLSTHVGSLHLWNRLHGLQARWDARAFEEMVRVAHFFSLFLSAWSAPDTHISWMTDEDTIVANVDRLEDAHRFAARLAAVYLSHPLGEFMMNTPGAIPGELAVEDFLAIPDLAAGMVAEVLSRATPEHEIDTPGAHRQGSLTEKSEIIADWFWHNNGTLKKCCIVFDRTTVGKVGIGKLKAVSE